ncbi:MAG: ABC transporter permease [Nocardioides sp.]|uniref:ABC transporter permease n=1 Tax=Nocardioides sp. TaxID=35761 RepID=UPI003F08EFFF
MIPTIAKLALQATVGRRRFWFLLALPLILVAVTVLIRVFTDDPELAWNNLRDLGPPLLVPLMALIAASSVLGPEMDDGSVVYLLAKPVNRYAVAFSKYVVALAVTLVLGTLPLLVAGIAVRPDAVPESLALWVGCAIGAAAYTALFLALSASWRHAVVVGVLFILIWESTLGSILSGVAWLSVAQWGARVTEALEPSLPAADIPLWWALAGAMALTVGGVWWAGERLRSFTPSGTE